MVQQMKNKTEYWCQNGLTGFWTYFDRRPSNSHIYYSSKIIARDTDGKLFWYKNRETGKNNKLTELELKESIFAFISVVDGFNHPW